MLRQRGAIAGRQPGARPVWRPSRPSRATGSRLPAPACSRSKPAEGWHGRSLIALARGRSRRMTIGPRGWAAWPVPARGDRVRRSAPAGQSRGPVAPPRAHGMRYRRQLRPPRHPIRPVEPASVARLRHRCNAGLSVGRAVIAADRDQHFGVPGVDAGSIRTRQSGMTRHSDAHAPAADGRVADRKDGECTQHFFDGQRCLR